MRVVVQMGVSTNNNASSVNDLDYKKNYLTVSQFAKLVGMSAATLRNYSESGKFVPEIVLDSGRRMYNISQVADFKQKFGIKGNSGNAGSLGTVGVAWAAGVKGYTDVVNHLSTNDDTGVYVVYSLGVRERLVETCEVVVKYLNDHGKSEYLAKDNMRIKVFSDSLGKPTNNIYSGLSNLGKYVMSHETRGILVGLNVLNADEYNLYVAVKTIGDIFGIPVISMYDLIKEYRRTKKDAEV